MTNMRRIFIARGVAAVFFLGCLVFWQAASAPFAAIVQQPEPEPSILFVGDIMLDRNVARHAMASGTQALFAGVLDLFKTADANVANLEGSITLNPSIAQRDNTILHFTFDPELARTALAPLNLAAASLANNHTYDFGRTGFDTTRGYLQAWGIKPFGNPYNARELSTTLTIRGKQFCLVGYHSLYDAGTAEVVAEVERLVPECYRVIVVPHWGDEYEHVANQAQVAQAHAFIDAGAHLVVGAHPHVVQNIEVYRGRAIFYSLGNFMFDQNFSWATQHGLAVKVTFGEATTSFSMTPISVIEEEAKEAPEPDAARVLGLTGRLAEFSLP
jgi:poly-gamma-glutamate capsule biosynthesis protein CapA/YwtB (metallophosphatase superfamily)